MKHSYMGKGWMQENESTVGTEKVNGESEWKKGWGQGKEDKGGRMVGAVQVVQLAVGNLGHPQFYPFLSRSPSARHLPLCHSHALPSAGVILLSILCCSSPFLPLWVAFCNFLVRKEKSLSPALSGISGMVVGVVGVSTNILGVRSSLTHLGSPGAAITPFLHILSCWVERWKKLIFSQALEVQVCLRPGGGA